MSAGRLAGAVALMSTALVAALTMPAVPSEALPPGFVHLRDVTPNLRQSMRYATAFNFTGAVVPGYAAAECLLTRPAAEALARVDAGLRRQGFALVVFDCYRPVRAVKHFVDWTRATGPDPLRPVFHPRTARRGLVAAGYIAAVSAHSRGSTVDVGLIRGDDPDWPVPPAGRGACDGPLAERPQETSLDLGTTFDCFSTRSAVGADLGPEVAANRKRLGEAMSRQGFRGYRREYWHYTYAQEPFPTTSFDAPVQ